MYGSRLKWLLYGHISNIERIRGEHRFLFIAAFVALLLSYVTYIANSKHRRKMDAEFHAELNRELDEYNLIVVDEWNLNDRPHQEYLGRSIIEVGYKGSILKTAVITKVIDFYPGDREHPEFAYIIFEAIDDDNNQINLHLGKPPDYPRQLNRIFEVIEGDNGE
jgi:hypothetical protein